MPCLQNYYSPVDVAILWGHFSTDEREILQIACAHPEKLLCYSARWPSLCIYLERLLDAIDYHELPARYLGHPLTFSARHRPCSIQLRAYELRLWLLQAYPDDKPDFLFQPSNEHCHCVSLAAHLALKAELDAANWTIAQQRIELQHEKVRRAAAEQTAAGAPDLDERSEYGYQVAIAALLRATVGKSADGQVQSIYKSQSDLTTAITRLFPEVASLGKHTLDRKFAAARRCLAKVT